jgi:hypothetical protein
MNKLDPNFLIRLLELLLMAGRNNISEILMSNCGNRFYMVR